MSDLAFMNPWAVYGLAVLIPVIILYLLKPKPKDLHIPSLMFIISIEQRKRFRSFFKKLFRDPLLILQLLTLCLLVLALANPFYTTEERKEITQNVVIVLDGSASMSARDVSPSRFGRAKDLALEAVNSLGDQDKVSVILAENLPILLLNQGDKKKALAILNSLGPKDTPTGVGNAILLARDIIRDSEINKRIIVISDFSHYDGMDPLAAEKNAFADGISVSFIKTAGEGENIGIINARAGRRETQCFGEAVVKNYAKESQSVEVQFIMGGSSVDSMAKGIEPSSTELFSLTAPCGDSEYIVSLRIAGADSLETDNEAYFIIPENKRYRVLLIRDEDSEDYVKYALESLNSVILDEALPLVLPAFENFDIIVLQSAKASSILPGTFKKLEDFVRDGGSVIIMGFKDLINVDQGELSTILPVMLVKVSEMSSKPSIIYEHQILRDIDVNEIFVERYLESQEKQGSVTLAQVVNSPFLAYWELGNGEVIYLASATNSSWSNFHLKPSFPIFWLQSIEWINRDKTLGSIINFRTGERLPFLLNESIRVLKPSNQIVETKDVYLDEAGVYAIQDFDRRVAASLLDERESDIGFSIDTASMDVSQEYEGIDVMVDIERDFYWPIAALCLFLIVVEWVYYKRRGSF